MARELRSEEVAIARRSLGSDVRSDRNRGRAKNSDKKRLFIAQFSHTTATHVNVDDDDFTARNVRLMTNQFGENDDGAKRFLRDIEHYWHSSRMRPK